MNRTRPAPVGTVAVKLYSELNGLSLAYLGDAVIELLAREHILQSGCTDVGRLNAMARSFVTAQNQSAALERLLSLLNEEETAYYKRGRNAKGVHVPKSATVREYRRSTGFEALFGYLYLSGQQERMRLLFCEAFVQKTEKD